MTQYSIITAALLLAACGVELSAAGGTESNTHENSQIATVVKTVVGERARYLSKIELTQSDFSINKDYGFVAESGQFELFLAPDILPVDTQVCETRVILRMPATISDGPMLKRNVEEKRRLFEELQAVQRGDSPKKTVSVELSPYVRKLPDSDATLALTRCNVFFRHHRGRHISHTDSL
jgi:hypothetical protein